MITRLTVELLEEAGGCRREITHFRKAYPDGVDITVETCVAAAEEWPWKRAAGHLVGAYGRSEYRQVERTARHEKERAE